MLRPEPGLFFLQVCTHDLKKALISLRRNGDEIASIFDQNHVDNHKNSMAGTTLIINLNQGDKVQVYMYTFTGLQDKPGNHLTQFMGFLIKANDQVSVLNVGYCQGDPF